MPLRINSVEILRRQLTGSFVKVNDVKIHASGGSGELVYQLNKGPFQNDHIFLNVPAGIHRFIIKDTSSNVLVPVLIKVVDEETTEWSYKEGTIYSVTKKNEYGTSHIKLTHPLSKEKNDGSISIHSFSKDSKILYKLFKQGMASALMQAPGGTFTKLSPGNYNIVIVTPKTDEHLAGVILVDSESETNPALT